MKYQTVFRGVFSLPVMFLLWAGDGFGQSGISQSKHNLSVSGPGPSVATEEREVCIFCHTPHHSRQGTVPLWNRNLSAESYTPYSSSSLQAAPGQPTGYSKLCLSCHDGTIALGSVLAKNGSPATLRGLENPMTGSKVVGLDLTNDHPVSFRFDAPLMTSDGELVNPGTLSGSVHLWPGTDPAVSDNVQCSSCHDAHETRGTKFLRKATTGQVDNICLTCHTKTGWTTSVHATSTTYYPAGQSQTTVRDLSCRACHHPHAIIGAERLLDGGVSGGQSAIEETCYRCHKSTGSGGVASDIRSEFTTKVSYHPVASYTGHKPANITIPPAGLPEGVLLSPGQPAPNPGYIDTKHVECVDCHNPHQATHANRTEGARGINLSGQVVNNVVNEPDLPDGTQSQYQICLRCHGDTYNSFIPLRLTGSSQLRTTVGEPASAYSSGSNKRLEFNVSDPSNRAYHPVAGTGRNQSAALSAQLAFSGLSTTSIIKCTDCHNSNTTSSVNGRASNFSGGPRGPHGSTNNRLLRANYVTGQPPSTPPMSGSFSFSANNFQLCFLCHDQRAFDGNSRDRGDLTNFYSNDRNSLHWRHLVDISGRNGYGSAVCAECHYNLHSNVEAANTTYEPPPDGDTHLVNFGPSVTGANTSKPLWMYNPPNTSRFGRQSPSRQTMSCNLNCHGEVHDEVDRYFYELRGS